MRRELATYMLIVNLSLCAHHYKQVTSHLCDGLRYVASGIESVGRLPYKLRLLTHLRDSSRVVGDRTFSFYYHYCYLFFSFGGGRKGRGAYVQVRSTNRHQRRAAAFRRTATKNSNLKPCVSFATC